TAARPWQVCRAGVSRTFQVPRVLARRTVLQNTEIGAFHRASSAEEATAVALAALERVGLGPRAEDSLSELSTAEIRRLELARAISGSPELLLLDEPLAGLSGTEVSGFCDLVKALRTEGFTIVVIEHTMSAMVGLVDRFIVLNNGAKI